MQRYKIEEYEAYKDSINIELFNEIVSFIFHTTNNDHIPILKELKKKVIWFKLEKDNSIQNNYGFKYIGELLERFEERIGNDIKDIRAIALSIAFTKELINGRMIIGTQLINFITKIEIMSKNDFYLKMALYIYDNVKYLDIFKQLLNEMPKKTEEIVFMFSAFADINDGLKRIGDKLEKSLGNERNMSVIKNAGIYNWLIKTLYPIIKGNRKKGIEFFKALITIPTGLLKEDSKEFNMLLNNGYNKIEIAFLNYRLIFYGSIPQTVRIGNSIVEEKIAINLCEKVLNNTETLEDELYEMVLAMLDEYEYFDIKYHGYEGLAEAIEKTINITNPKVFIKFYKRFYGRVYDFNILDPKWDIISQEFSKREYENLFNNYINSNEYNSEQLREIIRKYEELTHSSFIEFFYNSEWCKSFTYNLLVDKEIISLIESFEKFKEMNSDKKEKNALIKYVRGYISGIHTKKAFDF